MKVVGALSFLLRGGAAGAKFLFVFYLAGEADSTLLGQVAVLMTIAAFFSQVAGLETNQVIGRQLHGLPADDRWSLLRRQAQTAVVAYLVLVPTAVYVYASLAAEHWALICGILVLEHFIVEVYRVNILMLRTAHASGLLFVKSAGWMLVFVALVETDLATASFLLMLHCWLGVLVLSSVPLLMTRHTWLTLRDFLALSIWPRQSAALVWQARTFIVSAFAIAGIGAVDKLLIASKFSAADLGVYFFFFTIASIITLVTSFSIGATAGPRCIKVYATEGRDAYLTHSRRLRQLYWLTTLTVMGAVILPADFLLVHFGKADYTQQIEILYFLTSSAALLVLSEPYKLDAYLARQDRVLLAGNLLHLLSITTLVAAFSVMHDIAWIAAGVLLSSMIVYVYFALGIGRHLLASDIDSKPE